MMIHYDDEALLMYAEGTSPIRAEISMHVSLCAACAEMLAAHEELAALLKTAEVWEQPAAANGAVLAKGREFSHLAGRISEEEGSSATYVDEVLASPPAWWRTKILRERQHTIGVVRQLLDRARTKQTTAPLEAIEITKLAVEVADNLSIAEYPSDLVFSMRGHAYRDHAYVLSLLGRLPESLQATDAAEELFRQTAMPDYELARVGIMRAYVYAAIDRLPEAIILARRSSEVFAAFGDRQRYLNAQVTSAVMLFQNGGLRDAIEIWHSVLDDPDLEDITRLMVTNNLGMCYRERGDYEVAVRYLATVIAEYDLLGMAVLRTRSRGSLATTLVTAGRTLDALPILEQTWKEFEGLGMESDAALVALEFERAARNARPRRLVDPFAESA